MKDKADRAGTEMKTSDAQNPPVANERSQHFGLPSALQTPAQHGDMSEVGSNGGIASEAPHESAKVFTMLGNRCPSHDFSNVP